MAASGSKHRKRVCLRCAWCVGWLLLLWLLTARHLADDLHGLGKLRLGVRSPCREMTDAALGAALPLLRLLVAPVNVIGFWFRSGRRCGLFGLLKRFVVGDASNTGSRLTRESGRVKRISHEIP